MRERVADDGGAARDLILGVRVAHPDGTITKAGAKVVKNATAYDMTKLYLGSHGILRGSFQAEAPDALVQGLVAAREAVIGLGGHLTVLSLPDVVRDGMDVWGSPPDGLDVMQWKKDRLASPPPS